MVEMIQVLDDHFGVFIVGVVGMIVIFGSVAKAITTIVTTGARERSRREIAAYIAEGSISPEQGERLMRAEMDSRSRQT